MMTNNNDNDHSDNKDNIISMNALNNIKHNYNFICGAQSIDLIQNIPFSINQYILEQNRTEIATKYTKIKRDSVYSII